MNHDETPPTSERSAWRHIHCRQCEEGLLSMTEDTLRLTTVMRFLRLHRGHRGLVLGSHKLEDVETPERDSPAMNKTVTPTVEEP